MTNIIRQLNKTHHSNNSFPQTSIGNMDMLIAASAIAEDATLVTNNIEHFSKAASLKLENWC